MNRPTVIVHPRAAFDYHVQSYARNKPGDYTAYCDNYYLRRLHKMGGGIFVVVSETANFVRVEYEDGEADISREHLLTV